MSPRTLSQDLVREAPAVRERDSVEEAVRAVLASDLPALPVVDDQGRLKGIFGEREFMTALFPGYVGQLKYAGFVKHGLDEAIEQRATCRHEPVGKHANTEHVEVAPDFSDLQLAETFLHHRVLLIPVVDDGRLVGVVTRRDFFRRLGERFVE